MKNNSKKILIVIGILICVIILDSLQAMVFDNNPLIKIREYYNGGTLNYKDKGILVDTYCGTNGIKDTVIKGTSRPLSYDDKYTVVDETIGKENLTLAEAEEKIYEDQYYTYYFPVIKSQYVNVRYSDGKVENIIPALNNNRVSISDLDKFRIGYLKYEK